MIESSMIDTVSFPYICFEMSDTDAMNYDEYEAMKEDQFREYNGSHLLQVLQPVGNTLKSLIIQGSQTGTALLEYNGRLPCLENLNLNSNDYNIEGLLLIIHLCGNTLKSLSTRCHSVSGKV